MLGHPSSGILLSAWHGALNALHTNKPQFLRTQWMALQQAYRDHFQSAETLHGLARKWLPEELFVVSDLDGNAKGGSFQVSFLGLPSFHQGLPTSLRISRRDDLQLGRKAFLIQGSSNNEFVTFPEAVARLRQFAHSTALAPSLTRILAIAGPSY